MLSFRHLRTEQLGNFIAKPQQTSTDTTSVDNTQSVDSQQYETHGFFPLRDKNWYQGFTLPELLVVIVITGLVSSLLVFGTGHFLEVQTERLSRIELEQNFDYALDLICDDIRRGTAISGCIPDSLTIFTEDAVISYSLAKDPQSGEHLYSLDGNVLYRKKSGQSVKQPMANFIEEMWFEYYDADGNITSDVERVRCISVTISGVCSEHVVSRCRFARLSSGLYL